MKLKPCPFCGDKKDFPSVESHHNYDNFHDKYHYSYYVWCSICKVDGPIMDSTDEAVEKWNKRIDELEENRDYAYKTIQEYKEIVGINVNEAFQIGWNMARTTNKDLSDLMEGINCGFRI